MTNLPRRIKTTWTCTLLPVGFAAALALAGISGLPGAAAAADARGALHTQQAQPSVGWLTIRPKQVHIGDTITISGVAHGATQFLPPFLLIGSVRTHVIHRGHGLCGGTQTDSVATWSKPGGGSGGPGTVSNPPTGTPWHVTLTIPKRMVSATSGGKITRIPTPPGVYLVAATGVGLDYCTIPRTSSGAFSVNRFTILP